MREVGFSSMPNASSAHELRVLSRRFWQSADLVLLRCKTRVLERYWV